MRRRGRRMNDNEKAQFLSFFGATHWEVTGGATSYKNESDRVAIGALRLQVSTSLLPEASFVDTASGL